MPLCANGAGGGYIGIFQPRSRHAPSLSMPHFCDRIAL
jgi:hypothetical protein